MLWHCVPECRHCCRRRTEWSFPGIESAPRTPNRAPFLSSRIRRRRTGSVSCWNAPLPDSLAAAAQRERQAGAKGRKRYRLFSSHLLMGTPSVIQIPDIFGRARSSCKSNSKSQPVVLELACAAPAGPQAERDCRQPGSAGHHSGPSALSRQGKRTPIRSSLRLV